MKSITTKFKKQLLELVLIRGKIKHTDNWLAICCTCWLFTHRTNLQWWHFIPQSKWDSCRFELDNVNAQCPACNGRCNHGEQYKHWLYIDKTYWKGRADELHIQSRLPRKWRIQDLEDAIYEVEQKIIERYKIQSKDQKQLLINYISKNWTMKSQCKRILAEIQDDN